MNRPKLSIIIPTLNEEKNLPLLLESIKKQEFKDYEIIVADAGSQDNTVKIALRYDCTVVPGGHPGKGRNEGAKAAHGDELLFVDADVLFPEGFLGKFLKEVRKRNLDCAGAGLRAHGETLWYELGIWCWNLYFLLTQRIFPHASNCIYATRQLHDQIAGFDEDIKFGEDCVYARKAAKVGTFRYLSNIFCYVSLRRIQKEGLFRFLSKYIYAEFQMLVLGKNITHAHEFEYDFSHYSETKK